MIPANNFQRREHENRKKEFRPSENEVTEVLCRIDEVYDFDSLKDANLSQTIQALWLKQPGVLWAKITLINGVQKYAPFLESADQVYSTYGNAPALKGRPAKLKWKGRDMNSGTLTLARNPEAALISHSEASTTYDISGIL